MKVVDPITGELGDVIKLNPVPETIVEEIVRLAAPRFWTVKIISVELPTSLFPNAKVEDVAKSISACCKLISWKESGPPAEKSFVDEK